ncbi:MAG: SLC13 family permease, partial [Pseudomonadota bacterium]
MAKTQAQRIGLLVGPVAAVALLAIPAPDGLSPAGWRTAALMALMATWWATEAIPIPATSLLPLALLPLLGAGTPREVGAGYASPIVLLLLGGFIVALAIERWNLHKRIALNVVASVGSGPRGLIFGFMAATALLSMWISNTATTLMMAPIALSAAAALRDGGDRMAPALLLGICYAASIGGVATPIGTPTNLIAIDWLERNADATIGFPQWMAFGIPAVLLLVPAAWWRVCRGIPGMDGSAEARAAVKRERDALGSITGPEARAAIVFACVALLW